MPALELGQASHAQDLTTFRSANGQVVGAEGTLLGGPIPSSISCCWECLANQPSGTFTLPDVEGLLRHNSFCEPLLKGCGNNYSHFGSQYIVYQISYMIPRKCLGSEGEKKAFGDE